MATFVRHFWNNWLRRVLAGVAPVLVFGAMIWGMPSIAEQGKGNTEMSIGPSGWATGEDLRVPIQWMIESRSYGPGDYARKLKVDGRDRYYEVHVPPKYRSGSKIPVILVLHGGGGFPGVARFQTDMSQLSDETGGFIAVYPAGTNKRYKDRQFYWSAGWKHKDGDQDKVDDIKYFEAVLDDLGELFFVDQKRVFATGISNGAHMTYRLASELSNRIAAIAPVAGQVYPGQLAPPPPRPIPLIAFHGREDYWIPWTGGTPPMSAFSNVTLKAVPEVISAWAEHNGCPAKPARKKSIGQAEAIFYESCKAGADIELWELKNGGHTWPGGRVTEVERTGKLGLIKIAEPVGHINTDISASKLMWGFFKQHPLPE